MPLKVVDFHFPDGREPYVVSALPKVGETVDERGEWMVASVAFDLDGHTAVTLERTPPARATATSGAQTALSRL